VPYRVGIDLVAVTSVTDSVAAHGDRYLERIYTEQELADCAGDPERLAARFAAKEAAIKVLRPGDEPLPWREIEVVRDSSGWVELRLAGRAAEQAKRERIAGLAVSVTHEAGFASAVVVAELETGDEGQTDD
jgi:holo-[acyl-carrier protein] synthase